MTELLIAFVIESNRIEGIERLPLPGEVTAHEQLLAAEKLDLGKVCTFQARIAPGMPIRDARGMDVQVGKYIAPRGGPGIPLDLERLISDARKMSPWRIHVNFELLHPFMDGNGRTGRALWAWCMLDQGRDPFVRPFLHTFYYQTLEAAG